MSNPLRTEILLAADFQRYSPTDPFVPSVRDRDGFLPASRTPEGPLLEPQSVIHDRVAQAQQQARLVLRGHTHGSGAPRSARTAHWP
jgi:hypothetical protein